MSHFTVMVIGDDPEAQLAPFYEELENVENPKWDWYSLGGRWSGFFKIKLGVAATLGTPGVFDNTPDAGGSDQLRKGDIDIAGMRDDAATAALARWDQADALMGETRSTYETWDTIRDRHAEDISAAREAYRAQPAIVALNNDPEGQFRWYHDDVFCTREEMETRARQNAITTHAVLENGVWYERGEMGWFASVSGEKDAVEWAAEVGKLLDATPDDTLISLYDCHI